MAVVGKESHRPVMFITKQRGAPKFRAEIAARGNETIDPAAPAAPPASPDQLAVGGQTGACLQFRQKPLQCQLGRGIAFVVVERAPVTRSPVRYRLIQHEDADRKKEMAVAGDLVHIFDGRPKGRGRRPPFHKIVIVHASGVGGVCFQSANRQAASSWPCHGTCRKWLPRPAARTFFSENTFFLTIQRRRWESAPGLPG